MFQPTRIHTTIVGFLDSVHRNFSVLDGVSGVHNVNRSIKQKTEKLKISSFYHKCRLLLENKHNKSQKLYESQTVLIFQVNRCMLLKLIREKMLSLCQMF